MSIKDFIKPKYANSNPEVRKASIARIRNSKILLGLSLNDPDFNVRRAATGAIVETDNQLLLAEIIRKSKDLELRIMACKKISNQGLLGNIVNGYFEYDNDLRETAWEKLTDQNVLANVFTHWFPISRDFAQRTLEKIGDKADAYLRLIGKAPLTRKFSYTMNNNIVTEYRENRAKILDGITDKNLRDNVIHRILADLIQNTDWSGEKQQLVTALYNWEKLLPLTKEQIDSHKTKYISVIICPTIVDAIESCWINYIESAGFTNQGIHISASDQYHGPSGLVHATNLIDYKIITDGLVYLVFSSGRYPDNW